MQLLFKALKKKLRETQGRFKVTQGRFFDSMSGNPECLIILYLFKLQLFEHVELLTICSEMEEHLDAF